MNVIDVPQPEDAALCDEAAKEYAQRVRSRAFSVYRLASPPVAPHASLLVLTDSMAMDNRYFFSAKHRLPDRLQRAFLHEPYVLPAWSMRAMQHTPFAQRRLLAGRDILDAYQPSEDPAERWCRLLESYCVYSDYVAKTREGGTVEARAMLCAAEDFRRLQNLAAELLGDSAPAPLEKLEWNAFAQAFDAFDAAMRAWLGKTERDAAIARARALLAGDETVEAFDREYAFVRARDIDGYNHELASMGFPYGHLFSPAAYPRVKRAPAEQPIVENLFGGFYRARKRLAEYAARRPARVAT